MVRAMKVLLVSILMVAMFSPVALAQGGGQRAASLELAGPLGNPGLNAGFVGGPFLFVGMNAGHGR